MFNWFSRKDYQIPKDEVSPVEVPVSPQKRSVISVPEDGYTIGVNNEGATTVKVSVNGTVTTLTMNEHATRQMIKLLTATLTDAE
jgi:hypothetical protein